jgi:hypothetical protein
LAEAAREIAVGILAFGKSEFSRRREIGQEKSRNPDVIGIVHLRDAWQSSSAIEENQQGGFVKYRHLPF